MSKHRSHRHGSTNKLVVGGVLVLGWVIGALGGHKDLPATPTPTPTPYVTTVLLSR